MQIAAVVLALFVAVPTARADGDPASDVLPGANVFLPYPAPRHDVGATLTRAVRAANTGGNRLKVAVIARRTDLGSVPSLFGKPAAYARFLGIELHFFYAGVLVVVMPGGVGVYDGGASTAGQARALVGLVTGAGADALTQAGTAAVARLVAARALRYVDRLAPQAVAFVERGRRGATAKLEYAVSDDSGSAGVTVQVLDGERRLASFTVPVRVVNPSAIYAVHWPVPTSAPAALRFCVVARDASGNKSPRECARLAVG